LVYSGLLGPHWAIREMSWPIHYKRGK
jgi:hypothetical protein